MEVLMIFILSGLLAGCSPADPGNGDGNQVVGNDPAATASLTPSLTVNGASASTTASIAGPTNATVPTGTAAAVEPGDYTVAFGDGKDGKTDDGLNLILDPGTGWYYVAPKVTKTVGDGAKEQVGQVANMFARDEWSCWASDSNEVTRGTATLKDGHLLYLPGVFSNMEVSDMEITYSDETNGNVQGAFQSDAHAELSWSIGSITIDFICGAGDDDPR